ncbi:hypothetical protein J2X55_000141 [Microbacterium sp. 1154]|uniref:hypothetical protein n=1 Tax=Microbacterium sp. 1154 TaxID=2817733 RepID=UPI0028592D41|nr:hypothetical protein [Microbacterium sp. 1154]MDR6689242.1 hypothetical protein [Microbacterium sp. 1154]
MAGKAAAAVGIGVVSVAAGLVARSLVKKERESEGDGAHPEGWKAVTVLGDADAFSSDGYPEPLRRVAGSLEIRVQPAPGDKGFEVHARVREGTDLAGEKDPGKALRTALRDAKQVFETGEILRATPRPHGERPPTLLGGAVDKAEEDAKGEGVL